MSADTVARHTARVLDIAGPPARFMNNERWEIEVIATGDAESWELRCRAAGDEEEAAIDLERVMHALLAEGALEVVIAMPHP